MSPDIFNSYDEMTKPMLVARLEEAGVKLTGEEKKPELVELAEQNLPPLTASQPDPAADLDTVDPIDQPVEVKSAVLDEPVAKGGCIPSHKQQRAAIGAGYLKCKVCKEEIPNEFKKVMIEGQVHDECPADHNLLRAQFGAGYLVCKTCKQRV